MKFQIEKELKNFPEVNSCCIAVIGLGYVGLPLAIEFSKPLCLNISKIEKGNKRRVIGFDINEQRLNELKQGLDRTNETNPDDIKSATNIEFTSNPKILAEADVFIITVPTPIDKAKKPNLSPLKDASLTVANALRNRLKIQTKVGSKTIPIVIYESTVYPGATEEICVPIIEKESGLVFNKLDSYNSFVCGYSPERINPGDKAHRLTSIKKITSGSNIYAASWVDNLYKSIIKAGTHLAPSLKVAEAAKVIENTQRDLNIALINELSIIFNKLGIDTLDVLEAASTKWNFLHFKPGLVGGHCIGVDPYYLTYKAQEVGYHPEVVLAGRRINDGMSKWVVEQLVLAMCRNGISIEGSKVLLLGLTFKENCPDMRNTRVIDIYNLLTNYGIKTTVIDPWVNKEDAKAEYGINVLSKIPEENHFSAVITAVAHKEFLSIPLDKWKTFLNSNGIFMDLKGVMPRELNPIRI